MLTQSYIDSKYAGWLSRLSPALSAALRDQLQTRFEMEQVEAELMASENGVPMLNMDTLVAIGRLNAVK